MTDIPSYIDWHVGMKVVCIKRGSWTLESGPGRPRVTHPEYGEICTISRLVMSANRLDIGLAGYHVNSLYDAAKFRPVQTRKTSIEIFNRILLNPRIRISEDA